MRRAATPLGVDELTPLAPRDQLIVALDMPEVGEAKRLVERIGEGAVFYKVGMELAYGGGLPLVSELTAAGKQVFLDLKLHDIPNTVERATAQAAKLGARFLTVHGYPQTMRAAVAGAKGSGMQILAVTVLTSYDDADLFDAVYRFGVVETVRRRAEQALELGVDGLVASAAEAAMVRQTVGADLLLVTPGIRPAGGAVGDQKRVATPAEAIRNGADYLVVGRPVTRPILARRRRRSSRKSPQRLSLSVADVQAQRTTSAGSTCHIKASDAEHCGEFEARVRAALRCIEAH